MINLNKNDQGAGEMRFRDAEEGDVLEMRIKPKKKKAAPIQMCCVKVGRGVKQAAFSGGVYVVLEKGRSVKKVKPNHEVCCIGQMQLVDV